MASLAPTVSRRPIFAGGQWTFCREAELGDYGKESEGRVGSSKTRLVFGRYNIFSKADITEAVTKIEKGRRQSAA